MTHVRRQSMALGFAHSRAVDFTGQHLQEVVIHSRAPASRARAASVLSPSGTLWLLLVSIFLRLSLVTGYSGFVAYTLTIS